MCYIMKQYEMRNCNLPNCRFSSEEVLKSHNRTAGEVIQDKSHRWQTTDLLHSNHLSRSCWLTTGVSNDNNHGSVPFMSKTETLHSCLLRKQHATAVIGLPQKAAHHPLLRAMLQISKTSVAFNTKRIRQLKSGVYTVLRETHYITSQLE